MNDGNTLPRLLARNAARWPRGPAWRHKRLGIWQTWEWSDFATRCREIALGLAAHGFGHGDRLAVLGDNRPELYAAVLAAQILGGAGVPLDPDADSARLAAVLQDARVSIAVADTVEQADRLNALTQTLTSPPRAFCADPGGFHRHDGWGQASLDALASAGRRNPAEPTGPAPQDLALLLYPADALSRPLSLSHVQLLTAAKAIAAADPVRPTDEAFSYLPMSSYEDALYSLTLGLFGGFVCNCPEAPDSIPRDLREIGPTILFASPAACAALARLVATKAEAVTGFKWRCFSVFQRLALQAETLREQGRSVPLSLAIRCRIGEIAAYAPVRDQLGISRARWVHTVPSLPHDIAHLLRAFGVPLRPAVGRIAMPEAAEQARETLHA